MLRLGNTVQRYTIFFNHNAVFHVFPAGFPGGVIINKLREEIILRILVRELVIPAPARASVQNISNNPFPGLFRWFGPARGR